MIVKPVSILYILDSPEFSRIFAEYAEECANPDLMDSAKPDRDRYVYLEQAGVLHAIAVFDDDDTLVGGGAVIISPVLHFSKTIAVVESIFIRKEYRKGAVGKLLMSALKGVAEACRADGVYFSAPKGSAFEKLCRAMKLKETNATFFWRISRARSDTGRP